MKKTLSLLALFALLAFSATAGAYSVSMTAVPTTIGGGEISAVAVNLAMNPGEQLFGFNLALTYDPNTIGFDSIIFNGGLTDYATGVTPGAGFVTFDGTLNPDIAAVPLTAGLAPLATLYFAGNLPGVTSLDLSGFVLDNVLNVVEIGVGPASVTLTTVPEPGTVLLVAAGLTAFALGRRRRGDANL